MTEPLFDAAWREWLDEWLSRPESAGWRAFGELRMDDLEEAFKDGYSAGHARATVRVTYTASNLQYLPGAGGGGGGDVQS